MPLAAGTRIGSYEVLGPLGQGGMGEVYRARDPKLKRDVALKIVPEQFTSDADRLARFQREAEVLAALNHPNIAHVHGLEDSGTTRALVMELVEGDDLAERIARGPIPLDEALPIARQIADALDAAHEQGIIHRDLKPANIKVRADGTVKVLDFGLAKALDAGDAGRDASDSPFSAATITSPVMTLRGTILGTAAYMSPEQAKGRTADKRSDLWAFGCVLYEMLTGTRAFAGDTVAETLANVLTTGPSWTRLPSSTPPSVLRLLQRCLAKDRKFRLADAADARLELDGLADDAGVALTPPVMRSAGWIWRERMLWVLALLAGITAASILPVRTPAPRTPEMHVEIATPPSAAPLAFDLSPDGRTLAYMAADHGQSRLWLRSLETGVARAVAGTENADRLFWAPDSRSLAFVADGRLKRLDVDGTAIRTIALARTFLGGTWSRDGVILFASLGAPLHRVAADGGEPVAVSEPSPQKTDFSPQFLPNGRHFLYFVRGTPDVRGVYVAHLDRAIEPRRLLDADSGVRYSPSGHVLFVRQNTLFAQTFDSERLDVTGVPVKVTDLVTRSFQLDGVSASSAGAIAYRTGAIDPRRQFAWFDRAGREIGKVGDVLPSTLNAPALSRDGRRVAFYRGGVDGNPDIWLLETARGAMSRFTSDAADDIMPIWSPTGDRIVFSSNRTGIHALYVKSVTAGGVETLLHSRAETVSATDWSADGRFVLFTHYHPKSGMDVWALPAGGDGAAFPVAQTDYDEQNARISPDGKWIAFQSNESGRVEIYVQPFPGPGNKWPVSTAGGAQVQWRRDGNELFYLGLDERLMAVPIRFTSNTPDIGTPVALFAPHLGNAAQRADYRPQYMVAEDGERFLLAPVPDAGNTPISLILNWKVPAP